MWSMNSQNVARERDRDNFTKSIQRNAYSPASGMSPAGGGMGAGGLGGSMLAGVLGNGQSAGMQRSKTNRLGGAAAEFTQDGFGNFYNAAGQPVDFQTVQDYSAEETPLWKTEGYQGDSYLRGMTGVDANTAYNSETKRMALQGLFGSAGGGYGGGGYGGGGFSAQGPAGMIAQGSMGPNVNVGGPASYQQFSQPQGPTATPQMQSRYGGQGTFNDALMGMNQQTGVDAARANRQMQNQYSGNAANVQNQGVLGGLGLMNQQMQNAGARTQGAFNAANQWNMW
jgi:hypothetical protein